MAKVSVLSLEKAWEALCRRKGLLWIFLLWPLSWLYGAISAFLRRSQARQVPGLKVISVGNLSMGGSGKSPLVLELLRILKGQKLALALRGYGDDESRVYEARFPALPIYVESERFLAAQRAAAAGAKTLILDDGYQRRHELARDLDILLLDWERRDIEAHCFPAGRLREPLEAAREADLLLVTHAPGNLSFKAMREGLPKPYQALRLFRAEHHPKGLRNLSGQRRPLSWLRGRSLTAISGIGRPDAFEASLEALGAKIEPLRFPDHHAYRRHELPQDKDFVSTEKDAVKLRPLLDDPGRFWILEIEMRISPMREFLAQLKR